MINQLKLSFGIFLLFLGSLVKICRRICLFLFLYGILAELLSDFLLNAWGILLMNIRPIEFVEKRKRKVLSASTIIYHHSHQVTLTHTHTHTQTHTHTHSLSLSLSLYIYIYIYILPYYPSLWAGLPHNIQCPHRADIRGAYDKFPDFSRVGI